MSLLSNNKKDNKKGGNAAKNVPGSKFAAKPGKGANVSKKPIKTGGTRGS
ncbi:MAG: hypothetical protein H0X33_05845 [Taibaiella sp.]|nr:hypothetical protein [Taibaiella sp.]